MLHTSTEAIEQDSLQIKLLVALTWYGANSGILREKANHGDDEAANVIKLLDKATSCGKPEIVAFIEGVARYQSLQEG